MPIRKMMKEPAIAKEPTSMLKILRSFSPNIRNARKMASETRVAFHGCMAPLFDLISNIIGIDPGISMMANNTMKQAVISRKCKCMEEFLQNYYLLRQEARGRRQEWRRL